MAGAIDIHVHAAPDKATPRRADAFELVEHAQRLKMGGVVLKNHNEPTEGLAAEVQAKFRDVAVVGGVVLNDAVGGLNPEAVERSAKNGGRVLWFPTQSAQAHKQWQGKPGGLTVLDDAGKLTAPTHQILEVAKQYDLVVETGHLATPEIHAVIDRSLELGIERVVVTHANTMHYLTKMSLEEMRALGGRGVFVEYCLHTCMPMTFRTELKDLQKMIEAVPEDLGILSTDFGQVNHPIAGEGMWMGVATLLMLGMSELAVRKLVNDNPRRLLGV
jgi:hypothetical protein